MMDNIGNKNMNPSSGYPKEGMMDNKAKINKQKSEILPIRIATISDTEKIRYALTICE
jgi:hypothetical protein